MIFFTEKVGRKREHYMTIKFKCQCGCIDFYRDEIDKKHCVSFYEGSFYCSNCKKEHVYYSSAFSRVHPAEQLKLF